MTRDEALVKFLAEKVMGWTRARTGHWEAPDRTMCHHNWNPLIPGADTFQLWEQARRKQPSAIALALYNSGCWKAQVFTCDAHKDALVCAGSGPRAISEAIGQVFGFKWGEKNA